MPHQVVSNSTLATMVLPFLCLAQCLKDLRSFLGNFDTNEYCQVVSGRNMKDGLKKAQRAPLAHSELLTDDGSSLKSFFQQPCIEKATIIERLDFRSKVG